MKPNCSDEWLTMTGTKSEPCTSPDTSEVAEETRKMSCLTTEHMAGAQVGAGIGRAGINVSRPLLGSGIHLILETDM